MAVKNVCTLAWCEVLFYSFAHSFVLRLFWRKAVEECVQKQLHPHR